MKLSSFCRFILIGLLLSCKAFASPPALPSPEIRPPLDARLLPYHNISNIQPEALEGTAPDVMADLVHRWIAAFAKAQPRWTIAVPAPYGPPQGPHSPNLQKFLDGKSDFAFLSRDLTDTDATAFIHGHGFAPTVVDVAGGSWRHFGYVDAVVVAVNRLNPMRQITLAQLDALLSETRWRGGKRPRDWSDLGVPQWRGRPIHLIGAQTWRGEDSARGRVVRDRVLSVGDKRGEWRRDLGLESGAEADVPARVAADPLAIGFTGLGHLPSEAHALKLVPANSLHPIAPNYANAIRARYPLERTLKLVIAVPPNRKIKPELAEFIAFLTSRDGQAVVRVQNIFLPLTKSQAARTQREVARLH